MRYAYKELFRVLEIFKSTYFKLRKCIEFSDKVVAGYQKSDKLALQIKNNSQKIYTLKEKIEKVKKPNTTEIKNLTKEVAKLEAEVKAVDRD